MSASDYQTSVPQPVLTPSGFVAPSEQEILQGVLTDINAALGGNANLTLATPQGQLAVSQTAILGDAFDAMLEVFNGMDPAVNSGRMQEAIGRIYFLTRRAATATTVTAEAMTTGGAMALNAGMTVAVDDKGNLYQLAADVTLPIAAGQITLPLKCQTLGAVTCPVSALSLYRSGLGLTSVTNSHVGITGMEAESRAEFEARRGKSVAANSIGQNAAILGALLSITGVEDAYVTDNPSAQEAIIQGVPVAAYSLYVVVNGGEDAEIGRAIINHKSPGCATQGGVEVKVVDTSAAYHGKNPSYDVRFDRVQAVPLFIRVLLARSDALIPQDASDQVKQSLMNFLLNAETRPSMGATLYASRLATAANDLGEWADVLTLTIGTDTAADQTRLLLPINQILMAESDNIFVSVEQA